MSDQTITSLIEKLEGAEVGSRELDAYVLFRLDYDQSESTPPVTTSLDAALALAERVLPYAEVIAVSRTKSGGWGAGINGYVVYAATPALALCAAILRAQSEARPTGEDSPANEGEGAS